MGVGWFVVPMCRVFRVGGVRGDAVQSVSRANRWPSASGYLDLAGEGLSFFTRCKYGMCNPVFPFTVYDFGCIFFFFLP